MAAGEMTGGIVHQVLKRRGLRQVAKFCIVGASSTAIDFLVFYTLIEIVHLQQHVASQDLARSMAVLAAFLVAVTNGFYWNSRWTFRQPVESTGESRHSGEAADGEGQPAYAP